jgi:predicted ATP-dependent protease
MWMADPDFRSAFKVKADFDPVMDRSDDAIGRFCLVLDALANENGLRPIIPDGAARVIEWSARQAGGRGKMLARFGEIEDLIREADYEAGRAGATTLGGAQIEAALAARRRRNGRMEERTLELMNDDVIRVQTEATRIGQVNGLAVLDMGYHRFGKPTRITASASAGRAGIINIEREARLSGGIYDKGVLIITGWLRRRYAQERTLTLTASVTFEQSYAGVDGDSASIAEIIALLSELSGLPVDQAIAVTGSVDQHGELQPIGGLNEKVEGFYDLCKTRGLNGAQGVMFPMQNLAELNLRQDVAEAVEAGQFHLYALETLRDALEIAMGVRLEEIDRKVIAKLEAYEQILQDSPPDLPPVPTITLAPPLPAADPEI